METIRSTNSGWGLKRMWTTSMQNSLQCFDRAGLTIWHVEHTMPAWYKIPSCGYTTSAWCSNWAPLDTRSPGSLWQQMMYSSMLVNRRTKTQRRWLPCGSASNTTCRPSCTATAWNDATNTMYSIWNRHVLQAHASHKCQTWLLQNYLEKFKGVYGNPSQSYRAPFAI